MFTRNQLKIFLAFGAGSGLGALVTYYLAKKAFDAELEKEIADVKANYRLLRKTDYETPTDYLEKEHPETIARHLEINQIVEHARLNEELKAKIENYETEPTKERSNVFEKTEIAEPELLPKDANETLYETLKDMRTDSAPYLISVGEYFDDEPMNTKASVTYFAGDNIVCHEDDSVMLDPDHDIDLINLSRFGVASDSEYIVYVRNPRTSIDYEIVRDEGKYADMVAHQFGPFEDD